jgi:hypothetical protein
MAPILGGSIVKKIYTHACKHATAWLVSVYSSIREGMGNMKLVLAKKLRNTLGGWNFLHPHNGSLISSAIIALALGVAFLACGDNERFVTPPGVMPHANSVFVHNGDVYVAGSIYEAVLWKNGSIHFRLGLDKKTSKYTSFSSVCVTDDDVFLLGWLPTQDTLWKNGITQPLPDGNSIHISSLFVSGNDVYLAGSCCLDYDYPSRVATFWRNGDRHLLDTLGEATSIFVSGSDVYVAGYEWISGADSADRFWSPRLWKNGVMQCLDIDNCGSCSGTAWSVFVSGEDVYVAGISGGDAVIWKNGVKQTLAVRQQDPETGFYTNAEALSVFVSDGDVYVAGQAGITNSSVGQAVIWKNGVGQNLTNNSDPSSHPCAVSVFVSDGNVYVVGGDGKSRTTLWKNDVAQTLPLK